MAKAAVTQKGIVLFTREMPETTISGGKALFDWSKDPELTIWAKGVQNWGWCFCSLSSWVWSLAKMEKLAVNSPFTRSLQNGNQYSRHVRHLPTCSSRVFEVWQISQEIILLQSFWPGTKTKMVDFAEHKSSKKILSLSHAYIPRMHLCVFWSSLNMAKKKKKKHVFPPCWN